MLSLRYLLSVPDLLRINSRNWNNPQNRNQNFLHHGLSVLYFLGMIPLGLPKIVYFVKVEGALLTCEQEEGRFLLDSFGSPSALTPVCFFYFKTMGLRK